MWGGPHTTRIVCGNGGYRISTFQIYKITKLKYKTEDNALQSTDAFPQYYVKVKPKYKYNLSIVVLKKK